METIRLPQLKPRNKGLNDALFERRGGQHSSPKRPSRQQEKQALRQALHSTGDRDVSRA